jgi:hypothetical protein
MSCCICLEPPEPSNPLFLLSCGCKISWFHKSCEEKWLAHMPTTLIWQIQENPIKCPTCRQDVPLKYNYCFSPYAGEEQYRLWISGLLLLIDFLTTVYYNKPFLFIQSTCISLFPLIIRSKKDLPFFLLSYRIRFMIDYMLLLSSKINLSQIEKYRYLHLCVLIFFISYKKPYQNPFLQYAISADIVHKDTLESPQKKWLPKLVTSSLKRNKRSCKS